jgi:hypothetical protein
MSVIIKKAILSIISIIYIIGCTFEPRYTHKNVADVAIPVDTAEAIKKSLFESLQILPEKSLAVIYTNSVQKKGESNIRILDLRNGQWRWTEHLAQSPQKKLLALSDTVLWFRIGTNPEEVMAEGVESQQYIASGKDWVRRFLPNDIQNKISRIEPYFISTPKYRYTQTTNPFKRIADRLILEIKGRQPAYVAGIEMVPVEKYTPDKRPLVVRVNQVQETNQMLLIHNYKQSFELLKGNTIIKPLNDVKSLINNATLLNTNALVYPLYMLFDLTKQQLIKEKDSSFYLLGGIEKPVLYNYRIDKGLVWSAALSPLTLFKEYGYIIEPANNENAPFEICRTADNLVVIAVAGHPEAKKRYVVFLGLDPETGKQRWTRVVGQYNHY